MEESQELPAGEDEASVPANEPVASPLAHAAPDPQGMRAALMPLLASLIGLGVGGAVYGVSAHFHAQHMAAAPRAVVMSVHVPVSEPAAAPSPKPAEEAALKAAEQTAAAPAEPEMHSAAAGARVHADGERAAHAAKRRRPEKPTGHARPTEKPASAKRGRPAAPAAQ